MNSTTQGGESDSQPSELQLKSAYYKQYKHLHKDAKPSSFLDSVTDTYQFESLESSLNLQNFSKEHVYSDSLNYDASILIPLWGDKSHEHAKYLVISEKSTGQIRYIKGLHKSHTVLSVLASLLPMHPLANDDESMEIIFYQIVDTELKEQKSITSHKVVVSNLKYPHLPLKCKIQNTPDGINNYIPIKIKRCSDGKNLSIYLLNDEQLLVLYPFDSSIYQQKQNRLIIDGKGKQFNTISLKTCNSNAILLNYFFLKGFLQVIYQTPQNHIVLLEQQDTVKKLHIKNKSSVNMAGSQVFDEDGPDQNKDLETDVSFKELHITNLESLKKEGLQLGQALSEDVKIKNIKFQNHGSKYAAQRSDRIEQKQKDTGKQFHAAILESDEDPIKKMSIAINHHTHKFYVIVLRTNNRLDIYNNAVCKKSTYDKIEDVLITSQEIVIQHQNKKSGTEYSFVELKQINYDSQEAYEHDHQYLCSKFMPYQDDLFTKNFVKQYLDVIEKLFLIREFIFIISRFNIRIYDTVKKECVFNKDLRILDSFKFKNLNDQFSVYAILETFEFALIEFNSKGKWDIHATYINGGIKEIGRVLKPCRYILKQNKYFTQTFIFLHDTNEIISLLEDKFKLATIKSEYEFITNYESFAVINNEKDKKIVLANNREIKMYELNDDYTEFDLSSTIGYDQQQRSIFVDSAYIDRQNENQLILICYECIAYFNIKNEQFTSIQPLLRKDLFIGTILYASGSYIYANVNNQLQMICNSQLINNNRETKTVALTHSDDSLTEHQTALLYDYDSECKRIIFCYVHKNEFSIFPMLHKNYIIPYAFLYHDVQYTMHKNADFKTRFEKNAAQNLQNIEYLAVRRIHDKFYALDHNDLITTWSVVTGKLLIRQPIQIEKGKNADSLTVNYNIKELNKSQAQYRNYRYAFALDRDLDDYKAVIYHRYKFKVKDDLSYSTKNILDQHTYYVFKVISISDDCHVQTLYTFAYDSDDLKQVSKDFKKRMILSEKFIINSAQTMTLVTSQGESSQITCDLYNVEQSFDKHGLTEFPQKNKLSPFNPSITKFYKISTKFEESTNEEKLNVKIYLVGSSQGNSKKTYSIEKIDNETEARWKNDEVLCVRFPNGQKITIDTESDQLDFVTYDDDKTGIALTQMNPRRDTGQYYQLNNVGSRTKSLLQLIRKYQSLFIEQSEREDDLSFGKDPDDVSEKWLNFDRIYDKIIQCKTKNKQIRFEFPFTYRLWRQCEDIEMNPNRLLSIKQLTQRQLLFIILPNGESLLHKLIFKFPESIKILYDSVKSDPNFRGKVPFLINFDYKSIVDLCIKEKLKQSLYQLMACLSETSFQNNEIFILKCLPDLIQANPETLVQYLDSRLFSMPDFKTLNRGRLIPGLNRTEQYVFSSSSQFANINDIRKRIIINDKNSDLEEVNIKIQILSIPKVHVFTQSKQFFKELSDIEDMDIFLSKTIQILILSQWPAVFKYSILKLLLPYVFYMTVFIIYSFYVFVDYVNEHKPDSSMDEATKNALESKLYLEQYYFFPTLIALSLYFLSNEAIQIGKDKLEYFLSGWNYIDSLPPLCILLLVITGYTPYNLKYERIIYSIVLIFMWIKFLYFLRIFQSTAYLIRLIIQVLISMKDFLIVLFVTILAFSSGFQMLSGLNKTTTVTLFEGNFLRSFLYTYRMINGDFQVDDQYANLGDGTAIAWIFFFVCSLFNMIVMMNLLIAIISETFGKVKEQQENARFNQMACIIAENSHLIPRGHRNKFERPNDLLLLITMVDMVEDSNEIDVGKKVNEFSDILVQNQTALDSIQKQVSMFTVDFYDKLANKMRGSGNGDDPSTHQQADQLALQHDQNSKEMGGYSIGNSPRTSVLAPSNEVVVIQQHHAPVQVIQHTNIMHDSIQKYIQNQLAEHLAAIHNIGSNDGLQGDLEIFKRSQSLLFKQKFEKLEEDVKRRLLDIESDLQTGFQVQSQEINKIYQLLQRQQTSEYQEQSRHTEYGEDRKMQLTIDKPPGYMNPIQNFKRQSRGVEAFRYSQQQQNSPSGVNYTQDVKRDSTTAVVYSKYPIKESSSSLNKRSKTPLIADSKSKVKPQGK